jgi:hypothetical protein
LEHKWLKRRASIGFYFSAELWSAVIPAQAGTQSFVSQPYGGLGSGLRRNDGILSFASSPCQNLKQSKRRNHECPKII